MHKAWATGVHSNERYGSGVNVCASPRARFATAAETARPYVERAITDEEFRESLRAAFVAAKQIYDELMPQKGVTGLATKVAKDEDVQESLKRAVVELRNAADRMQEAEKARATASATSS